jgi:hypothetical protein
MKRICFCAGLAVVCLGSAAAQILPQKKKEEVFYTPVVALSESQKLLRTMSDDEYQSYMWNFRLEKDPQEKALHKDIVDSETGPFLSRRSVWSSETIVPRSAELGGGKYSAEAAERALPSDRWAASQLPEADYPGKAQDDAILAAVYRHFFDYRKKGFGKYTTVYFLGLGPHVTDAPPSVLAALDADPTLKKDGVIVRPISRSLEVTDDAIRDRDTGAYGAAFRVDDIGPIVDGEAKVTATFSERDGFWFTRQLTLREGKTGWEVVKDDDFPINQ